MSSRIHYSDIKKAIQIKATKMLARRGETITLHRKGNVYKDIELSASEIEKIDAFYSSNFGKKIRYEWHKLYKAYTGNFDERFLPDYLYSGYIEPKWNSTAFAIALSDKNLQSLIFFDVNGVRIPQTHVKCINGMLFDGESHEISTDIAADLLCGVRDVVIKKTVDTDSGKDVSIHCFETGKDIITGKTIEEIMKILPDNYVIQEKVRPLKEIADIYDASINTFRVITYIWNSEFHVAPIAMRLGRNGSRVDNIHAGGLMVAVHDNGTIGPIAYSVQGDRFDKHPDTGTIFKNIQFDFVDRLKETAISLHMKIPELGIVSWDLTVDSNGEIVLIEANTRGQAIWMTQSVHGVSIFGENTGDILKSIK